MDLGAIIGGGIGSGSGGSKEFGSSTATSNLGSVSRSGLPLSSASSGFPAWAPLAAVGAVLVVLVLVLVRR